jgi:hypothetical protein
LHCRTAEEEQEVMTFINWSILIALLAVGIPILIHLFNRRKAKVIEWGAMRFLTGSLVNRRRRVLLEEVILLALRCLLVALVVLAVARPFSPVQAGISWLILLPLLIFASTVLAVATVMARSRRWRWLFYVTAAGVALLAIFYGYFEQLLQSGRWASRGRQDVAIIIDGSTSMTLKSEGKRNFERAVDDCRSLIEKMGESDNVSIIVAGTTPRVETAAPVSVRGKVNEILDELQPAGGSMSMAESLLTAASTLASGDNAAKKIVVITDGQNIGWDAQEPERWQFAAAGLDNLPTTPRVICRMLPLPQSFHNATLAGVALSREIVGTDRPVTISVRVENSGSEPIEPEGVELRVDGETVDQQVIGEIASGESEQVRFEHQFESPGTHVLEAIVLAQDDLPNDNGDLRVVETVETLPVLLVDGAAAVQPELQATSFVELALAPPQGNEDSEKPNEIRPDRPALVAARRIAAPDLDETVDFGDYRVVVLADVPRLTATTADRLAEYVVRGGGLLVAPGSRCQPSFYNKWSTSDGQPVLPAQLQQRITLSGGQSAARPVRDTFKHPALARVAAHSKTDVETATITGYWQLQADESDTSAVAGAMLDRGDPLLVEREVGKGRVAVSAITLDDQTSNLPGLMAFVPMVHELTYHLATPEVLALNFKQGSVVRLYLPRRGNQDEQETPEADAPPVANGPLSANVSTSQGEPRQATVEVRPEAVLVTLVGGTQPGLHHFRLPEALRTEFADAAQGDRGIPVAVTANVAESRLAQISEVEEDVARNHLDYFRADSADQMVAAVTGDVPGHELWQYLAAAALVILVVEIFLTRFIAVQRKTGTAEKVDFISEGERIVSFRERAREFIETARAN